MAQDPLHPALGPAPYPAHRKGVPWPAPPMRAPFAAAQLPPAAHSAPSAAAYRPRSRAPALASRHALPPAPAWYAHQHHRSRSPPQMSLGASVGGAAATGVCAEERGGSAADALAAARRWPNSFEGATTPALVTSRISKSPTLASLCELLGTAGDFVRFDVIALSAAINRLGKQSGKADKRRAAPANLPQVFEKLVLRAEKKLSSFEARHLANMLHGIAVSGFFSDATLLISARKLYYSIVREIEKASLDSFNPQDLGNVAWSLAKVNWECKVYSMIADRLKHMKSLQDFNAQAISNISWAMAKMQVNDAELFSLIAAELASRQFSMFKPQELSNVIWAMATLEFKNDDFIQGFLLFLDEKQLSTFASADLANLAWSLATLQVFNKSFMERLAQACLAYSIDRFSPQEMCNTAWAYARLNMADGAANLFIAMSQLCVAQGFEGFATTDMSHIAWAFAALGVVDLEMFDTIANLCFRTGAQTLTAMELTNLVWAFAALELDHPGFYKLIITEINQRGLTSFTAKECCTIAWSYCAAGVFNLDFLRNVATECTNRPVALFSAQSVANLIWAFASSEMLRDKAVIDFLNRDDDLPADSKSESQAKQYFQVLVAWYMEGQGELPPVLRRIVEGGWVQELGRPSTRSSQQVSGVGGFSPAHLAVAKELGELGYFCTNEHLAEHGLIVDLLVTTPKGKVLGVLVDDPSEFLSDGVTLNGKAKFKHRLVAKLVGRDNFVALRAEDFFKRGELVSKQEMVTLLDSVLRR